MKPEKHIKSWEELVRDKEAELIDGKPHFLSGELGVVSRPYEKFAA